MPSSLFQFSGFVSQHTERGGGNTAREQSATHPAGSRTPSITMILFLTDFLLYLMPYHFQLQFLIHSEVCVCVYIRIYKCKKSQISKSLNL